LYAYLPAAPDKPAIPLKRDAATRPALSIVVPTYNERHRLRDLVETIFGAYHAARLDGELVIVDDNSPDGTGGIADELARRFAIKVLHRAGKLGLGTAVVAGFDAAAAPIVGVIDADLSHPPHLVPQLLAVMTQTSADLVIGSRYIAGGGTRNWPLVRLLMSRLACLLARPLTPVRDATSGFFLIRRDLARAVRISAGGFKICLELLVRVQPRVVVEVPYMFEGRAAGESKMNLAEALGYLQQLRDLHRYRRSHRTVAQTYRRITPGELERSNLDERQLVR
jgi:dolichol-phosphate mannosyltransferase